MQAVPLLLRTIQSSSVAFPLLIAGICGILLNLAGGNEFRTLICIYAIALTLPQPHCRCPHASGGEPQAMEGELDSVALSPRQWG